MLSIGGTGVVRPVRGAERASWSGLRRLHFRLTAGSQKCNRRKTLFCAWSNLRYLFAMCRPTYFVITGKHVQVDCLDQSFAQFAVAVASSPPARSLNTKGPFRPSFFTTMIERCPERRRVAHSRFFAAAEKLALTRSKHPDETSNK